MFKPDYLDMSSIVNSTKISKLFNAVESHGGTIRLVGGAVRDTLAGLSGFDLDFASDLSPDELAEACQDNGLTTVPVGLKSGTTGVVINDKVVEVSSLRRSIKTESNKNNFEYTDDWSADASQRDLTINAVYADLHGNVFDYYDGIHDLEAGIVRFIGNPEDRIKEDYLRIMRFFRFYSRFGKAPMDKDALQACIKLKDGLRGIAIERVRDELFKLLVTPNVTETMRIIYDNDILGYFLPKSKHLDALKRLTELVADAKYEGNFLRRLFVLYQPNSAQAESISSTLRFTKKQKDNFTRWAKIEIHTEDLASPTNRLKFIYRYGKDFCIDKLLITAAIEKNKPANLNTILQDIENAVVPIFPVRGRDIVNAGITQDAKIGNTLLVLEQQWIDSDFSLTRDELLNSIKA
ncbi:MAG: CCA tRNA nucleotidyltransferase [Alphaproteobacteria bacterium]|nr:CCA tRNA nucleotidyltransferase [Alphaproteobacteria bacterium]